MARRDYIDRVLRSLGGKLVGFWYAYGDIDLYVIGELPDNNAATAFSMHVRSSGPVRAGTVVLVTPGEFDQAHAIPIDFRPPRGRRRLRGRASDGTPRDTRRRR